MKKFIFILSLIILISCDQHEKHKKEYKTYLKSTYWQETRQLVLKRDKYTCQRCGSHYKLEIHHLSYKNRGHEKEHLSDLVTLCDTCHEKITRLTKLID